MSEKLTLVLMAGLPSAGKSTIASALSNELQWDIVDKDKYRNKFLSWSYGEYKAICNAYEVALGKELQWDVVDKDKSRNKFLSWSYYEDKASYNAYEVAFAIVRYSLANKRKSVILDCVGLHDFILKEVTSIVHSVGNVQLKVILCVVNRDLRKERLEKRLKEHLDERPPRRVVINDDLETDDDYFKVYKLPREDTYVLHTDNRTIEECLADAKDHLGQYALCQT